MMNEMTPADFISAMKGRSMDDLPDVSGIVNGVRTEGDTAVRRFTREFDNVDLARFEVCRTVIEESVGRISPGVLGALEKAAANIDRFARAQIAQLTDLTVQTAPGIICRQRVRPLERVAVYAPGGRYPLPSSVLMGAVPAKAAGVQEIILFTPPKNGEPDPVMLAAAEVAGVDRVFAIGGAQAVAACAFGTDQVPRVDKVVGPGNRYVTAAKQMVFGDIGIDLPAGPSELLVLADESADPVRVATDLLAQAEHDPDAVAVLVTTDRQLADQVLAEIEGRVRLLPTGDTIRSSLKENGRVVIAETMTEAIAAANAMAPEHLSLVVRDAELVMDQLSGFGTLFVGGMAAVALGDYVAGVNHILPTGGTARFTGGLSALDFVRLQTVLEADEDGMKQVGWAAVLMADSEGLAAHADSVRMRLRKDRNRETCASKNT